METIPQNDPAPKLVPPPEHTLLEMQGIQKVFLTDEVETHALSDVHLKVQKGEWLAIVGPSGSGKTTLLAILGLLDTPTGGSFFLDGRPVQDLTPSERAHVRNRHIGFIFQSFNLIGDLTVFENVELPLTYRGMAADERRKRVEQALERVGMSHRARHMPGQLSGGQQQRVAVARALANRPKLVLADEPTGSLDARNAQQVLELIRKLCSEVGASLLLVSHDPQITAQLPRAVTLAELNRAATPLPVSVTS